MAYNNLISRTDVQAMISETVSDLMLNGLETESAALNLFTRINVPTNQTRFPVLSALPTAYFVTGDTGLKQTTEVNWSNEYINIEEMAAIVPIPDSVLNDSSFDIFGTVRPKLIDAIGVLFDAATIFGTSKPASWDQAVVPGAVAAGNVVARGTNTQADGGIAEDTNDLLATLESDGYVPTGFVGNPLFKRYLRGSRDSTGQRLMDVNGNATDLWGLPIQYPMPGGWPTGASAAELIALQRQNFIVGLRQDFTFTIHTEGVVTDGNGLVVYNLWQQDMSAIRVVFRAGYAVANQLNRQETVEANRWPAAVLRSPA
jgi:HK97 family phage major capsid protein